MRLLQGKQWDSKPPKQQTFPAPCPHSDERDSSLFGSFSRRVLSPWAVKRLLSSQQRETTMPCPIKTGSQHLPGEGNACSRPNREKLRCRVQSRRVVSTSLEPLCFLRTQSGGREIFREQSSPKTSIQRQSWLRSICSQYCCQQQERRVKVFFGGFDNQYQHPRNY
jgi:hypothetical protein